jgi:large subunit ribosomal protein L25
MAEVFNVSKRTDGGRQACKHLRRAGSIPAILYGHGEASVSLAVKREEVAAALRHSGKIVELKGEVSESALIRAIQWDTYGIEVLHVDLMRVSQSETVDIKLSLELRGEAAGSREGGIVNFITHEIEITCPVSSIPEHLYVNVSGLRLGDAIHASELELPAGATLLSESHAVIVSCMAPLADEDTTPGGAVVEPELIRKPKEEGEAKE